jgi:carboxyl-terminal processing protease
MRFRLITILISANCLFAETLNQEDAIKVLKTFLDYHVDQKQIDQPFLEKIKKNFINLFDSEKTYLLQSEVESFKDDNLHNIQKNIETLEKGKFDAWQKEFYAFKYSIQRARGLRDEIYRQLLLELQQSSSGLSQNQLVYARDFPELKERWIKKISRFLAQELKFLGLEKASYKHKEEAFRILEAKIQKQEERFMAKDRQACFYEHFLKTFAKSLDAHSAFFTKNEGLELKKSLEKQFEGIGVSLRESLYGIVVTDLVAGAPAHKAGIQKGDLLLSINGKLCKDLSYDDVLKSLEGPKGSEVKLTLKKHQTGDHYCVTVQRQTVVMQEGRINSKVIPYGNGLIGVIKLSSFYDNKRGASSEIDLKEAISQLKSQGPLYGLVLDLRQNSGGFLSQAVKVAGLFMKTGVVAVSRYAHGRVTYLRDLDPKRYFEGPLVVLTSKASASAAEVVAAALQDYGRALIVGDDRTYGKGSIQYQNVTEQDPRHYYKVTVGRYFTVSGKTTQIEGVRADINVPSFYHQFNIGERFLENPLSSDKIAPHYLDPLLDIEDSKKAWFQKNYLPYLQTKEIFWAESLTLLKANSQFRIDNSEKYQKFLQEPLESLQKSEEDLPLKEAVSILKDALILNNDNAKSCIKSQ